MNEPTPNQAQEAQTLAGALILRSVNDLADELAESKAQRDELREVGRTLAMLVLQSDLYARSDVRQAVDDMLDFASAERSAQ